MLCVGYYETPGDGPLPGGGVLGDRAQPVGALRADGRLRGCGAGGGAAGHRPRQQSWPPLRPQSHNGRQ